MTISLPSRYRAQRLSAGAERPLVLAGLACAFGYAVISRIGDLDHHRDRLALVVVCAWAGFALAARLALGERGSGGGADPAVGRRRLALVVLLAACCQLPGVLVAPQSSSDAYRYVWDGRVQLSGTSPYRYVPLDDHLARLRDPLLFPGLAPSSLSGVQTLKRLPTDPQRVHLLAGNDPRTRINRPRVPTIYPPVAQAWFAAVAWLTSWSWGTHGLQIGAALLAVGLTLALGLLLRRRGADPAWALCWGWCPLVVLEAGNGAHVDVLAAVLVVGAFAVLGRRGGSGRDGVGEQRGAGQQHDGGQRAGVGHGDVGQGGSRTGVWLPRLVGGTLLGLAAATKIIPLLLLPAVTVLRRRQGGSRAELAVPVSAVGSFALSYLPHVLTVGSLVIGYLPGYLTEEGFSDGDSRYAVIGLLLPPGASQVTAFALAAALGLWALWRCDLDRPERTGVWLFGGAILISTPSYDWYCLPLVGLAVLAGRWEWLAVAAAGYLAYAGYRVPGLTGLAYGLAGLFVVLVARRRAAGRSWRHPEGRYQPHHPLRPLG